MVAQYQSGYEAVTGGPVHGRPAWGFSRLGKPAAETLRARTVTTGHADSRAMINGFHAIIYSDDAEVTPGIPPCVPGWPSIDAGGGWLIFKTPPSEVGVHPTRVG